MPARGPVVLTEDEVERILDLIGAPDRNEGLHVVIMVSC